MPTAVLLLLSHVSKLTHAHQLSTQGSGASQGRLLLQPLSQRLPHPYVVYRPVRLPRSRFLPCDHRSNFFYDLFQSLCLTLRLTNTCPFTLLKYFLLISQHTEISRTELAQLCTTRTCQNCLQVCVPKIVCAFFFLAPSLCSLLRVYRCEGQSHVNVNVLLLLSRSLAIYVAYMSPIAFLHHKLKFFEQ